MSPPLPTLPRWPGLRRRHLLSASALWLGAPAVASPQPRLRLLNEQLRQPWALAFLPDGQMLVTEKAGQLRRLTADGRLLPGAVSGVPEVLAAGQGGLMDLVLDPDFARNGWLYLSYSEPGQGAEAGLSGTAVLRARLEGERLREPQVILRQTPKVRGRGHYGSRLAFAPDGSLFVSLGERQLGAPAEALDSSLGKILRIWPDGRVPADNPDFGPRGVPGLWSLGHRNPQGLAVHPQTGELWSVEHGPQGGDELNRVQRGGHHGWPRQSLGCDYGAPVGEDCRIGGGRHAPTFVPPVATWGPLSTAPSDLLIYQGKGFAAWQGDFFVPALAGRTLWRLRITDGVERLREPVPGAPQTQRLRCVRQGPDGWLYLLSDEGRLMCLSL